MGEFSYVKYSAEMEQSVKDLLLQLQRHLATLDERNVLVVKEDYTYRYFKFVTEEIAKYNGEIFVAVKSGSNVAVGLAICKIVQGGGEAEITTSCPKVGFINDLVVSEEYRGQGIGTRLIEKAELFFKEQGCDYTQLEVFAPNREALAFYQKLGFEVNCYYLSKKTGEKI